MTRRSRAREVALQLLFQHDLNRAVARPHIERFINERLRGESLRRFCVSLYDGVCDNQSELDERIAAAAQNWKLHRMPAVDRNLLRIGALEIIYHDDTPAAVAVDEAIELAKRFGSKDSASFINGVLDKIRASIQESGASANE